MIIIKTVPLLRGHIRSVRKEGRSIALIPTMGNLHDGHIKLINTAKIRTDIIVVSIFINPMQFDRDDDLLRYPRTFQKDCEKLSKYNVDFVFAPEIKDIYPNGINDSTYVHVPIISTILEGSIRLKHFQGVSTIVSKLFNLIQPNVAYFGEKDYQQLILIRKMVIDMGYDIDIISVPTVRAKDGLALSSRNNYLTTEQRKISPSLNKIINTMAEDIKLGKLSIEEIITIANQNLNKQGFRKSNIYIRDADTLFELTSNSKRLVILVATLLGKTRLIDNKVILLKE